MYQISMERFEKIQKQMAKSVIQPSFFDSSSFNINYRKELNENQLSAVTTVDGPLLIIAGAGSGKTRTLTYRCSYFLENGIPPEKILLLTFTRKAANEMLERINDLLGKDSGANKIWGNTFHGFAHKILRQYASVLDISPKFQIMDASDMSDAVDMCAKELEYNKKKLPPKKVLASIISKSKNWNVDVLKALQMENEELYHEIHDEMKIISEKYEKYKKDNHIFDFDDLMLVLLKKLKDNPEFREMLNNKFDYIMVDEFQDTNVVQSEIIEYLGKNKKNIMVVGDDAQSIYAFRGANVENIFGFVEKYSKHGLKVVKIEKNYRSTKNILKFANNITKNAKKGFEKSLYSTIEDDSKPLLVKCANPMSEATTIRVEIEELLKKRVRPENIAVIVRSGFHNNHVQMELLKSRIDYILIGGLKFNEKRHVKDIMAFLRIMTNPFDQISWHRVLQLVPKVGKATAGKIVKKIYEKKGEIDFSEFEKQNFYPYLQMMYPILNLGQTKKTVYEITEKVIDLYGELAEENKELIKDFQKRLIDLSSLKKMSGHYKSINGFLNDFTLDPPDSKDKDGNVNNKYSGKVVLTTTHSSKGLEFDYVFMPHLLDGLFPSEKAMSDPEGVEEERRVFYVAATRAKKSLFLSYPEEYVQKNQCVKEISRFVDEQLKIGNLDHKKSRL